MSKSIRKRRTQPPRRQDADARKELAAVRKAIGVADGVTTVAAVTDLVARLSNLVLSNLAPPRS